MINFLISGTQKGGTSALDVYLREHPQICMAQVKEVHFFDREVNFNSSSVNYSKYHSFFEPQPHHVAIGEATPIYMYWDQSPKRIHQYNPHMKLILLLRNPIDRAYSHWNMECMRGADDFSFADAIYNEKERCQAAQPLQHRVFSYIDRGFYSKQLKRLWSYFPKQQILILKSEQLKHQPLATLNKVCDFLGVERFKSIQHKKIHARPYQSQMAEAERRFLQTQYQNEIKELEHLLDWDCSEWQ